MLMSSWSLWFWAVPPNKSLHGSGTDKVLGRGRPIRVLTLGSVRARVLNRCRAAPELSRYAPRDSSP